jgi:hypothetical protein
MRSKRFTFPVNPLVGSTVVNIIALWRKHRVDLAYLPKFLLTLLVAGIFELFNLWERIVLKRKLKTIRPGEPPVFIIGFWRSGTTLLHNLLCRDPKAAFTTTFQVVFPHSHITQASWLKPLTNLLLPPDRPFDNVSMDMDFPQEEEYGLTAMQSFSFYHIFNFPNEFDQILRNEYYSENLNPGQLMELQRNYTLLIQKAMLNTGGTRYMSKNPCSLGRIQLLLSMYPDARFIFIYRNPYKVVESLYRFMLAIFPGTQLQKVPDDFTREKIVKLYAEIMNHYFSTKSMIPESRLLEIKMEDFVKDQLGYLEKVYKDLEIQEFETARSYFEDYLSKNANYSRDPYEIPAETYHLMNQYASEIILRLGYEIQKG